MTASADVERLWLAALQELGARVAHEVKNVLNGAAVNLEVVRARSAAGAGAERLAPFAETAALQLEELVRLQEALLWAVRAPVEPPDVALAAAQLVALCLPVARAAGGSLWLEGPLTRCTTAAPGLLVRTLLARVLLDALGPDAVVCHVTGGADCRVEVAVEPPRPWPPLPPALLTVAEWGGVAVESRSDRRILVFPAHATPAGG